MTEPSDYSPDSGSAASAPEQVARPAAGERAAFARVPLAAVLAWGIAGMVLVAVSFFVLVAAGRIGEPVTVTVDGLSETVRSTRPDVAGVLADLGLALRPEDRVSPPLATRLAPGLVVTVVRARAGLVSADGRLLQLHTQAGAVGELVAAAGVQLGPHDEIWLDGAQVKKCIDMVTKFFSGSLIAPQAELLLNGKTFALTVDDEENNSSTTTK